MSLRRGLMAAWVAAVIALTAPWFSFQPHSHWYRVTWIPFTGIVRLGDVLLNGLLYLPLGLLRSPSGRGRTRDLLLVAAPAFALSAMMELSQVYSHGRDPTATDVASNVSGAVLGLLVRWSVSGGITGAHPPDAA